MAGHGRDAVSPRPAVGQGARRAAAARRGSDGGAGSRAGRPAEAGAGRVQRRVHRQGGAERAAHPHRGRPRAAGSAVRRGGTDAAGGQRAGLAEVVQDSSLPRRGPRPGAAQRTGAQASHLRADRGHGGGGHQLAAGADRRRPQLRLPVRMDPRHLVRARLVHPARPHPGSPGHAGLDAELHLGLGPGDPSLLRPARVRAGQRDGTAAARLPRLPSGPRRQPRRGAAAVGMLRRPARMRMAGRGPGRSAPRPGQRGPAGRAGQPGLRHLDQAGLRDLGTRRAAAQHLLQGRLLGGAGPADQAGQGGPGQRPGRGPVEGRAGGDPGVDQPALLVGGQAELRRARRLR